SLQCIDGLLLQVVRDFASDGGVTRQSPDRIGIEMLLDVRKHFEPHAISPVMEISIRRVLAILSSPGPEERGDFRALALQQGTDEQSAENGLNPRESSGAASAKESHENRFGLVVLGVAQRNFLRPRLTR